MKKIAEACAQAVNAAHAQAPAANVANTGPEANLINVLKQAMGAHVARISDLTGNLDELTGTLDDLTGNLDDLTGKP